MTIINVAAGAAIDPKPAPGTTIRLEGGRHSCVLSLVGWQDVIIDGGAAAELWRGRIELTDCQRVTIRGVVFRQAPASAIVFNTGCRDCVVESCSFLACGISEGGVTMWIGAGTSGIAVQRCRFDMLGARGKRHLILNQHCYDIAIMCAEDDCVEHRLLDNRITQYSYGIQLGVRGICLSEGRHLVQGNRIEYPWADGIHLKQGRILVKDNTIIGAFKNAMSARAGAASCFVGNRIEDAYLGLVVRGRDHEIRDNHFERCRRSAISLMDAKAGGDGFAAENTLVVGNELIDCGGADAGPDPLIDCAGIHLGNDLPQRIGVNRIVGAGTPLLRGQGQAVGVALNGRGPTDPIHRGG
ncbi:hypothetical protein LBMAG53_32090 [Planctomycetota bacterium]|nr:hypothetical protein LBMAG53_32090 [Planctomycetota bacterium]